MNQKSTKNPIKEYVIAATEYTILHHEKWNRRILRLMWVFMALLLLFEGGIALLYCTGHTFGAAHTNQEYLLWHFLLPCGAALFIIILCNILMHTIYRHSGHTVKSYVLITSTVILVSALVAFNHGANVIFMAYTLPIMLSVVFVNRTVTLYTYTLSLVCYIGVVLLYLRPTVDPAHYQHSYIDMLVTIGLLTAAYVLCLVLLNRTRELINTAVQKSVKQLELSRELERDSLTQLYNHAAFYEQLDEKILRAKQYGEVFSLLVIDLDNFKSVNDTYGHATGDTVILRLVRIINMRLQQGEAAFRYGGEEFAILTGNRERAITLAEHIRADMERQAFQRIKRPVTVSIGMSVYDRTFGGRREFFSAADKALYAAKRGGKNCLRIHEYEIADSK